MISPTQNFVATYVPGFGASDFWAAIFSNGQIGHFYNEETAYTTAHGAAIYGMAAVTFLKSHGIAKAMNSVIASLYAGNGAAFVNIVFEDTTGSHSDNPFVASGMLEAVGARVFSPKTEEEFKTTFLIAAHMSASVGYPTFISIESTISKEWNLNSLHETISNAFSGLPAQFTPNAILCPILSAWQESRRRGEAGVRPNPKCPDDLGKLKETALKYKPVYSALNRSLWNFVSGDASTSGLFFLPPYSFIQAATHIGSAIPLAMGASLAGAERVLACVGDFSFTTTGALALGEMKARQISADVLIFANGGASATGGQIVPLEMVLNQIPRSIELHHIDVLPGFEEKLNSLLSSKPNGPRVAVLTFS